MNSFRRLSGSGLLRAFVERRSTPRYAKAAPVPPVQCVFERLEPRILLSADLLGGIAANDLLQGDQHADLTSFDANQNLEQLIAPFLVSHDRQSYDATAMPVAIDLADFSSLLESASEDNASSSDVDAFAESLKSLLPELGSDDAARQEIIFVDAATPDYEQLIDGIATDAADTQYLVFVLDAQRDGVAQIGEVLANYSGIDAIHLVSHGSDGEVRLGNGVLNSATLYQYQNLIQGWSTALDAEADFLIYGCNLAASEAGQGLLQSLAGLTGADIAASDDLTGSAQLGADWELEYNLGVIEAQIAFSQVTLQQWQATLAGEEYIDQFDTIAYDNSDGSKLWSTAWQEGGEINGANAGRVYIDPQTYIASDNALFIGMDKSVEREIDLSGVLNATLTFDWAHVETTVGDSVVLEIYDGSTWNTLETFAGPVAGERTDTSYNSSSHDISAFLDENTRIRFAAALQVGYSEFAIDNVAIDTSSHIEMVWVDQAAGKIQAAELDGSNAFDLITGLASPLSVAVDTQGGKVYWSDGVLNTIQRANFDGSGMETIVSSVPGTVAIDLDTANGKIYWVEGGGGQLSRANLDGSAPESLTGSPDTPSGIAIDVANDKIYWADPGNDRIKQTTLDGIGTSNLVSGGVGNSADIALNTSTGQLYWSDDVTGTINRVDSDGTNITTVISGLSSPYGLAVDGGAGKIYWTDSATGQLHSANLDGSDNQVIATGLTGARDVDVVMGAAAVVAANSAPIAVDDANYTTNQGQTLVVDASNDLLENDSDADADTLNTWLVNGPANGILNIDPTGLVNATVIASSTFNEDNPAWSPDGSKLAFTSDRSGFTELWVINSNGTGLTQVTTHGAAGVAVGGPAWSPDGSQLYFHSNLSGGDNDIYVIDAATTGVGTQLSTNVANELQPSVSPDGSTIAFISDAGGDFELYIEPASGGASTQLTFNGTNDRNPVWSPDGSTLLFTSNRLGNFGIYEYDIASTTETLITSTAGNDQSPEYSPDGSKIIFHSNVDGDNEIFVYNKATTLTTQLTNNSPAADRVASWSPDGTKIVYVSDIGGNKELVVASLLFDGTFDYIPNAGYSGVETFTYKATDGSADSNLAIATITVNTAPTADAGGPYTINEGDSLVLDASASSDPETTPTYTWDIDGDGQYDDASGINPTVTWASLGMMSLPINDDGSYTIEVRVDDGEGGVTTDSVTLTVNNVAPTLSTTGTGSATEGLDYTLNLSAIDPGDDIISSWTINWGDGSIETIAGNPTSVAHTYVNPGFTYNILASAVDEDGTYMQNELLVANSGDNSLLRFGPDAGFLQQFGTGDSNYPVDIIVGPDGNLYVSGWNSDDVLRYNATTGAFIDTFIAANDTSLESAAGLAFGPDGNLYVASRLSGEVLRFDASNGNLLGAFVATATSGGLTQPEGLTFGPDGDLYVSDYDSGEVYKYDGTTGVFDSVFVKAADSGGLVTPEDLTFGPDGNLYVASDDGSSVLRYNGSTGASMGAFIASGSNGLANATGITFGPDGNLYVASWGTDSVLRFNGTTGAFIDVYISTGSGTLSNPDYMNFIPEHQVTVAASGAELWLSTNGAATDDSPTSITSNEVASFGGPDLQLELGDGTSGSPTDGTFSHELALQENLRALHYVNVATTVDTVVGGTAGTYNLQPGQIVLSMRADDKNDYTLDKIGGGTISANNTDVLVYDPGLNAYDFLLEDAIFKDDGSTPANIHAISIVEKNITIGVDTTLTAGTYLIARSDPAVHADISTYNAAQGRLDLLLGVNFLSDPVEQIQGIELIETATTVGGVTLSQGTLLISVTTNNNDPKDGTTDDPITVGTAGGSTVAANQVDIVALTINATEQDIGAYAAANKVDAQILFDGSDIGFAVTDDSALPGEISGLTTVSNGAAPVNQAPTGSITISGSAQEDSVLTVNDSLADADGMGAVSYQWQRNGVDISGATGTTYTLDDIDVGKVITVEASYTDGAGKAEFVESAPTAPVAGINDAPTLSKPGAVFINEIHYDNTGVDFGEGIEIAGVAGTSLNGWSLVLYNGFDGSVYHTEALTGIIPNETAGFGAVAWVPGGSDQIQNGTAGNPDGFALVDNRGNVVQFLSYEGTFTALEGPAAGMLSTDIGVQESELSTAPLTSLQLTGTGTTFSWSPSSLDSFGALNTGQDVTALAIATHQNVLEDGTLVFSTANGNSIDIADPDDGQDPLAEISVQLNANRGTLTLGDSSGLKTTAGVGTSSVTITGSVSAINNALEGLSYTVTPDYNGAAQLAIWVDDQGNTGSGGDLQTGGVVHILVAPQPDDPTLDNAISDQLATEASLFSFTFASNTFGEVDGDTLTYSAKLSNGSALPGWLTFNPGTRTFFGTPLDADVGSIDIEVTADDSQGGTPATDIFKITVGNINNDPTLENSIPEQSATGNTAFNFTFAANTFSDDDSGDTLSYTATLSGGGALPAWLIFDDSTRTFSGIPTNADATISVQVSADDGNGGVPATEVFDIVVSANNSVIAYEGFDYSAGSLDASNGGTGWANAWLTNEGTSANVIGAGLADPTLTLAVEGGAAEMNTSSQFSQTRDLSSAIGIDGTTVWLSFLLQADNVSFGGISIELGDTSNDTVTIGYNNNDFLITKDRSTTGSVQIANSVSSGTTYFLAARIDFAAGADTITLYLDPTPGLGGPDSLTTALFTSADLGTFTQVGLIGGFTGNNALIDEVRIGNSYLAVAPDYTNSPPSGAVAITGSAIEDNTLAASNSLADADGMGAVSYQWQRDGVDISGANGTSYTLGDDDVGSTITVNASYTDGAGKLETSSSSSTAVVTGVNDDPTLENAIADQLIFAHDPFSFTFTTDTFDDADGDGLTYSAQLAGGGSLPTWLSFDQSTRTFSSAEPGHDAIGFIDIEVIADDSKGGTAAVDTFRLTIDHRNDDPTVDNPIPDQLATEDSPFSFTFASDSFSDFEGQALSYTATLANGDPLPGWLSFNAATRTFSGTPLQADVGAIDIEVVADDGAGGTTDDSFEISIGDANDDPLVANPISDQPATEDSAFSFVVPANTFSDEDTGDTLSYSATLAGGGALPGWLSFDTATRMFSGTPLNGDVGSIDVEVTADDGNGGTAAADIFRISVANSNDDPTLDNAIADQLATEDSALSFTFNANTFGDVDTGASLTYSATLSGGGALPTWLSFNAATREFSGTPLNADVGSIAIEVTADDGQGGTPATDTFTITVANDNNDPTLDNAIADQLATEDSAFSFTFNTNTFGDVDTGASLTYSATLSGGGALPTWLSFNAATREFSGTPLNADVGSIDVEVTADDGQGGTPATDTFSITIANDNDDPTLDNAIPNQNATEDNAFSFTFSASAFGDVDTVDSLSYSATLAGGGALPSWLSFDNSTRTFSGIPLQADVGFIDVEVTADDGNAGTPATDTFRINIANSNDAPGGAVALSTTSPGIGETISATLTLSDEDGLGAFSYQWQRAGVDIAGATASTYVMTTGDVGSPLTLVVSYTDAFGQKEAVTSNAAIFIPPVVDPTPPTPDPDPEPEPEVTEVGTSPESEEPGGPEAEILEPPGEPTLEEEVDPETEFTSPGDEEGAQINAAIDESAEREVAEQLNVKEKDFEVAGASFNLVRMQSEYTPYNDPLTLVQFGGFVDAINQMREDVIEAALDNAPVVGSTFAVSAGMSAGYVAWLARSGAVLGSVMSAMPMWRFIDPLPVLNKLDDDSEDEESLEAIIENSEKSSAAAEASAGNGAGNGAGDTAEGSAAVSTDAISSDHINNPGAQPDSTH